MAVGGMLLVGLESVLRQRSARRVSAGCGTRLLVQPLEFRCAADKGPHASTEHMHLRSTRADAARSDPTWVKARTRCSYHGIGSGHCLLGIRYRLTLIRDIRCGCIGPCGELAQLKSACGNDGPSASVDCTTRRAAGLSTTSMDSTCNRRNGTCATNDGACTCAYCVATRVGFDDKLYPLVHLHAGQERSPVTRRHVGVSVMGQ